MSGLLHYHIVILGEWVDEGIETDGGMDGRGIDGLKTDRRNVRRTDGARERWMDEWITRIA